MRTNIIYEAKRRVKVVLPFYLLTFLPLVSCTDYLDKTPDSDVNPEMAFMNFTNFQGFVEEAYNCAAPSTGVRMKS